MSTIIIGTPNSNENNNNINKAINYFDSNNFQVISKKIKDIINENLFISPEISGLLLFENSNNQTNLNN